MGGEFFPMRDVITLENFQDVLDAELGWRKKEIFELRSKVFLSSESLKKALIRSCILIVYAHWEGYVKKASELFFIFLDARLSRNLLSHSNLDNRYVALSMWSEFNKAGGHNKPWLFAPIVEPYISQIVIHKQFPTKNLVDTESNLNTKVLSNILFVLGIDDRDFFVKKLTLDQRLLAWRNKIAHGERINVETETFRDTIWDTINLIELFDEKIRSKAETISSLH
jgi:hypothetical protein